jgi:SHS2 domain-containing protein
VSTERSRKRSSREFDHTGDLGIDVEGESLAAVFEEAASGMFGLLTDLSTVDDVNEYHVSANGADVVELLLNWLSELNFMHLTERVLFCSFNVKILDDVRLEASVGGESIDPVRHKIHTEIKAVTYHEMVVEERKDRWYARVIFDI